VSPLPTKGSARHAAGRQNVYKATNCNSTVYTPFQTFLILHYFLIVEGPLVVWGPGSLNGLNPRIATPRAVRSPFQLVRVTWRHSLPSNATSLFARWRCNSLLGWMDGMFAAKNIFLNSLIAFNDFAFIIQFQHKRYLYSYLYLISFSFTTGHFCVCVIWKKTYYIGLRLFVTKTE